VQYPRRKGISNQNTLFEEGIYEYIKFGEGFVPYTLQYYIFHFLHKHKIRIVSYGCETWYHTVNEKCILTILWQVFVQTLHSFQLKSIVYRLSNIVVSGLRIITRTVRCCNTYFLRCRVLCLPVSNINLLTSNPVRIARYSTVYKSHFCMTQHNTTQHNTAHHNTTQHNITQHL